MSFSANGTPWSGPRARPALRARSAARAARRASSATTRTKLLRALSCAAIRASESSTSATAEIRPAASARLAAVAVSGGAAGSARMIGPEDEVDLVCIGEAPWHQREQLAHRLLRLLGLPSRRVVKMVEGNLLRVRWRRHLRLILQ